MRTCLLSSGCWRSWTWAGVPPSRAAPDVSRISLAAFLACANSSSLPTALSVTRTSRLWLPAVPHCSTLTFWVRSKLKSYCVGVCRTALQPKMGMGTLRAMFWPHPFYNVLFCVDRDPLGESCLPEEAPPVLSTAPPPGRLLLLTDRHASRPGALGCLPQCVHKEELHSVTSGGGGGHLISSPSLQRKRALCSRFGTKAKASRVRWCKRLPTRPASVSPAGSFSCRR